MGPVGLAAVGKMIREGTEERWMLKGIDALGPRKASDMSHGERQSVAVARALATSPELVLADEPTASLESGQGAKVIETIHAYVRESGATAIVASHDGRLAALSDRTLALRDGRLNRGLRPGPPR